MASVCIHASSSRAGPKSEKFTQINISNYKCGTEGTKTTTKKFCPWHRKIQASDPETVQSMATQDTSFRPETVQSLERKIQASDPETVIKN